MSDTNPSISVETLLSHQAWVRALARSLVRDAATAEDLSQEAMLAALRSPPRDEAATRAWFRRVLRNRLLNRIRATSRRAAREAAVARPEAGPSLAESLERVERHRQVVDLVLDLPSPFRETVVLRFFDELTPKEIGERLGVPASTVRSRLTRALAMLRERLDEEHGGDRRAWCVALLPLLDRPRSGVVGKAALVSGGAVVMGTKLKILVAAAVLVVAFAGIGTLFGSGGEPPPVSPEPGTDAPASVSPAETASRDGPAADEAVRASAPEETAAAARAVRVRVLMPDGTPAAGAEVRLLEPPEDEVLSRVLDHVTVGGAPRPGEPPPPANAPEPVIEAVTDADGSARLVPAGPRWCRVVARHAGLAAAGGLLTVEGGEEKLVVLRLGPAVDLHGRVLTPDGGAIAGARVELGIYVGPAEDFAATVTDRAGRFEFPGFPMNARWMSVTLRAGAEGYAARGRTFDRKDRPLPRDGTIDIVLPPGIQVAGRCVDERGTPLAGIAVVSLVARREAVTGPDGRFELRGLEAGAIVRFLSRSHGHRQITVGEAGDLGDVTIVTGGEIAGRVVDGSGEAVPDVLVELRDPVHSVVVRRGRADAEGRFRFAGVGTEPLDVSVRGPAAAGSWANGIDGRLAGVVPGGEPVRIVLAGERTLLIRLQGASADKVFVRLEPQSPPGRTFTRGFVGDAMDSVRLELTEAGLYRVTVLVPGCRPCVFEGVEVAPDRPTEITADLERD